MKFISFLFLLFTVNFTHEEFVIDLHFDSDMAGRIHVAVYDGEKDFLSQEVAYIGFIMEDGERKSKIRIPHHIKSIAIASFQDCNHNVLFDFNLIGIPKEPYSITNNCRAKWQEPTFEEAKIDPSKVEKLEFKLEYWKNR